MLVIISTTAPRGLSCHNMAPEAGLVNQQAFVVLGVEDSLWTWLVSPVVPLLGLQTPYLPLSLLGSVCLS